MDVMQKFRERLRRSSSSDVKSICIPTIPDKVATTGSGTVIRRYSIPARPKLVSDARSSDEGLNNHRDSLVDTQLLSHREATGPVERTRLLEAYQVLQFEKSDIELKLKSAYDKLKEKDETVRELQTVIRQIKEDRLQDEEVRYQRSILEKRQYIDRLEAEIEKMKAKIEQDNIEVESRVKKAKKKVSRVKQDCALKIFELQQENLTLKENIKRYEANQVVKDDDETRNQARTPKMVTNQVEESKSKNELVVRLSEQISSLVVENLKLKEELQITNRKLSRLSKSQKSAKSVNNDEILNDK